MNKDVIKLIIKVLIYALTLIGSAVGVTSVMSSCSVNRNACHSGTGYFQYYDTIHVHGQSNVKYGSYAQ